MIHLTVVTPTRNLIEAQVDEVILPGRLGYLGVLPGHAPLLTSLAVGRISYRRGGATFSLWGANLTEEDGWAQGYDVGAAVGFAGLWTYTATRPPRTYGMRLTYSF